jgi:hypothetical protein
MMQWHEENLPLLVVVSTSFTPEVIEQRAALKLLFFE